MPSFCIEQVPKGSSFKDIVPIYFGGNYNPRNACFEFVYPIRGSSKEAYDTAEEDCRNRIATSFSKDPCCHWIQILDDDNDGAVVAVLNLYIYDNNDKNPHNKDSYPPVDVVTWWPEGEKRKFVNRIFEISFGLSRARKRRPHMSINNIVTDPKYRRQGAALMLVRWVAQKADGLGLECHVPAHLQMGVPLYKKVDFLVVDRTMLAPLMGNSNPSDEWKACLKQLGDEGWDNMWRPVGGVWEPGAKYPWEE